MLSSNLRCTHGIPLLDCVECVEHWATRLPIEYAITNGLTTWTCHACGERRTDRNIGVITHKFPSNRADLDFFVNIRHCTDRVSCIVEANDPHRWNPLEKT